MSRSNFPGSEALTQPDQPQQVSPSLPDADLGPAWRFDLSAGITAAIISIPQGLAFALLAGVSPIHGLYAAIVPTIVAALIRKGAILSTGVTNSSALVVGVMISSLLGSVPAFRELDDVSVMLLICMTMGLVQVAFGVFRLGRLGRYVSQSVLVGFAFGGATLIAIGQIKNIADLESPPERLSRVFEEIHYLVLNLGAANVKALAIAVMTWVILIVSRKISPLIPGALIAICVSAMGVWALGWDQSGQVTVLHSYGQIPRGLPATTIVDVFCHQAFALSWFNEVLLPALALGILGIVETVTIGKSLSNRAGQAFGADREILALGVSNLVGPFFGCLPGANSWVRSSSNFHLSARTHWTGVYSGLAVLAIVLLLAPWAGYVPKASLGAIVFAIAIQMFDLKAAGSVWRWSLADATVMGITFVAIVFIQIQYAIYLGVFASLIMLVRRSGILHLVEMVETSPGQYREHEIDEESGSHPIALLQLEGDLFFGVSEELEAKLQGIAARGARVIVLRLKRAHGVDATAADMLTTFLQSYQALGGRLVLCGLRPTLHDQIKKSELGALLGPSNLLMTGRGAFASVASALESARGEIRARGCWPADMPMSRQRPSSAQDAWSYTI